MAERTKPTPNGVTGGCQQPLKSRLTAQSLKWEGFGLALLGGLAVFFLATSWRKWPDPLIDFGRELYVPWRLAQGAVLYRDVDDFYGPLSQYLNAGIFALFGPGLMVLVTANLVVFAAILAAIYILCRRAWGPGAALAATAVLVAVFGFSQFAIASNYNFATPYSHETTHGFLICLLLVIVLVHWVKEATPCRSLLAGGLFGLSALLKPEILLGAGLVTLTAFAIRWRQSQRPSLGAIAAWAGGAIVPTLAFIIYFSAFFPWTEAIMATCRGWLNVVATTRFTGDVFQFKLMGFDEPWKNFVQHLYAVLLACALIAVVGGVAWLVERCGRKWLRCLLIWLLVGGLIWAAWFEISWIHVGRCLLGLTLIYTCVCGVSFIRRTGRAENREIQVTRLLIAVLAGAMMARMILRGRVDQFGYYQAALAGVLVPAVLIGELPGRLGAGWWGRVAVVMGSLALLVPGVVKLAADSQHRLRAKTYAVGEGVDRFYTFIDPTGIMVSWFSELLCKLPPDQTLVVLPEGEMINYLARQPSPVSPFFFFSAATRNGREEVIVKQLALHPPDRIVIISRDLREYGVQRYGVKPGSGGLILRWVDENYKDEASLGGDPLDERQFGGVILKRRTGALADKDLEATRNYRAALQLGPDYAKALNNPGDNPESFFQLGVALGQLGRTREAAAQYREALRLNPDLAEALNNLAWILAASSEAGLRNGAGAVRLAERACELTHYGDPLFIRTLADAYAEDGQFAYAVAAAQKACDVALANGQKEIAEGNEQLLRLFKSGRAYHEESKPTP